MSSLVSAGRERRAEPAANRFRIAAVSAMTGIPTSTIRVWEFRYGAVSPERSAGNGRLYSAEDIERLRLLKAAVEQGSSIGTVASLGMTELRERLRLHAAKVPSLPSHGLRVLVAGAALGRRLRTEWAGRVGLEIVGVLESVDSEPQESVEADLLLVHVSSLSPASLVALRRLRSRSRTRACVVSYGFGSRRALAQLDEEGVLALVAPAGSSALARLARMAVSGPAAETDLIERFLGEPAAPARFTHEQLDKLLSLQSRVQCECPNHIADLVGRLAEFERYALDCGSRNEADAAVHARLHAAASRCREVFEHVLEELLDHEGVEV